MNEADTNILVDSENIRIGEYKRLRGYFPCSEAIAVERALHSYRRLWIAKHVGRDGSEPHGLIRVHWHLGNMFDGADIRREANEEEPDFEYRISYYGPVLAQVQLFFDDGSVEIAHIYCPMT